MNIDQIRLADDKSEVTNFTGEVLYVGEITVNTNGKSKTRQTISIGESKEKYIQTTIWDGNYDKNILGAKIIIKKATVDIYKEKRRLTTNVSQVTVTNIQQVPLEVNKSVIVIPTQIKEPAPQVITGSTITPKVDIAPKEEDFGLGITKDMSPVKMLDTILDYYNKKLTPMGLTSDNIASISATIFIEVCKRIRKDKY